MKFFKVMLSSMLGTFLTLVIIMFISFVILLGMVYSLKDESKTKVEKSHVLEITLDEKINERSSDKFPKINPFAQDIEVGLGLDKILASIKHAADDDNIKGIYLNIEGIDAGIATVSEIRHALEEFKKSKKFIISYSEIYSLKSY